MFIRRPAKDGGASPQRIKRLGGAVYPRLFMRGRKIDNLPMTIGCYSLHVPVRLHAASPQTTINAHCCNKNAPDSAHDEHLANRIFILEFPESVTQRPHEKCGNVS